MSNPYEGRPDYAFWKRAVAGRPAEAVDPVIAAPFRIGRQDPIATAGSCFAQNISRVLVEQGYRFLVTEPAPAPGPQYEGYGVFPARFGNIYTARQLLQTFLRAYGAFRPVEGEWRRKDGAWIDPFRPRIQASGFASLEALEADRGRHLRAVRAMFEQCAVFVFTLGLTEAWRSRADGAVYPLAPGVAGGEFDETRHEFHNFDVAEVCQDMTQFLRRLRVVNPTAKVILSVSPVPLVATAEDRHVLVSTVYSKSVLRLAAEMAVTGDPAAAYFPAYEIITGPQARGRYFAEDLRNVTAEGVQQVMTVFARHFLSADAATPGAEALSAAPAPLSAGDLARLHEQAQVICDEEAIDG